MVSKATLCTVGLLACSLLMNSASAAKLFRYKDENGVPVTSSTLPPEVAQNGYEIVNELGVVIETVAPRKTDEQLRQEKLEAARQREEERKRLEQEQLDAILTNSYTDISDIERARDNELNSKDRDIMLLRQNIRRLTRLLEDAQARAARDERLGKPLSEPLMAEIKDYKARIALEQAEIDATQIEKQQIEERYNTSIIRFSELKAAERLRQLRNNKDEDAEDKAIFECKGLSACDKAWAAALRYASDNSTTELAWANDTTIMMRKPREDDDISLVLTRVNTANGDAASIVLEVRCNKTQKGEALCNSAKVQGIRDSFTSYLR